MNDSMDSHHITSVIEEGRLRDYIIGNVEEGFSGTRPEEDYARWNRLEHYYLQLPNNSSNRNIIENEILGLIEDHSALAVGAGTTLARLLNLRSSEPALQEMIRAGVYDSLPEHTQNLILDNLARLRFESLGPFLIQQVLDKKKLLDFVITWRSSPPHVGQVVADDLWRIELLAGFYEHEAQPDARNKIESQFFDEHPRQLKLERIVSSFLSDAGDRYPEFGQVLRRLGERE